MEETKIGEKIMIMENGENWLRNCSIFKSIEKKKLIENGLRVWRKGHEEDDRTSFHTSQMEKDIVIN